MTAKLTAARTGTWSAIDNWPALASTFTTKFKTDAQHAQLALRDPTPEQLPAICVSWSQIAPEWWVQDLQQWPLPLSVCVWFPGHQMSQAEQALEDIANAIFQAKPEGSSVEYVRNATGYPPKRLGPISLRMTPIGRSNWSALRGEILFVLRTTHKAFGE